MPMIFNIPQDVLVHILLQLSLKDILSFCGVCIGAITYDLNASDRNLDMPGSCFGNYH